MSAFNSLLDLKARLEVQKISHSQDLTGPHISPTSSQDLTGPKISPSVSQEITDHRTWIEKIKQHNNKPEDWLDFLRFMQQNTSYCGMKRSNFLSSFFEKALKAINLEENRKNDAFAQIFVDFARIRGEFQPLMADEMLSYARCTCKRAAIIYIASAELKVKIGNKEKAKSMLLKGQNVDAQPAEMLVEAMTLLKAGETELMPRYSYVNQGTVFSSQRVGLDHIDSRITFIPVQQNKGQSIRAQLMNGPDHEPEMDTAPINPSDMRDRDSVRDRLANSCRPVMRKYSSSPSLRNGSTTQSWKSSRNLIPLRVKKLQPCNPHEEMDENEDILADIKPLEGNHDYSVSSKSGHTSGYISMSESHVEHHNSDTQPAALHDQPCMPYSVSSSQSIRTHSSIREEKSRPALRDISRNMQENRLGICEQFSTPEVPYTAEQIPNDMEVVTKGEEKVLQNILVKDIEMPYIEESARKKAETFVIETHLPHQVTDNKKLSEIQVIDRVQDKLPHDLSQLRTKTWQKETHLATLTENTPMLQQNGVLVKQETDSNQYYSTVAENNEANMAQKSLSREPVNLNMQNHFISQSHSSSKEAQQRIDEKELEMHRKAQQKLVEEELKRQQEFEERRLRMKMEEQRQQEEMEHKEKERQKEIKRMEMEQKEKEKRKNNSSTAETSEKPMPSNSQKSQQMEMVHVNGNPYTVIQCIGKGGSSKVYKVLDNTTFSLLALKVVRLDDTKEQIVEGYRNEISLLKRLQYCPKVIHLHDFEIREDEKRLYILMESGDVDLDLYLKNKVQQEGKLSPLDVKYHWNSMLRAVAALHKEGIIHSDLKPSNFLLIKGQLKLIDFGIAKAIQQDKTSIITDCQVGTLNYMSPETIQENCGVSDLAGGKAMFKIGVKSDVWSLGCILYNMVYGYTPFQKIVRQFAKLQAITNPNHVIDFPDIPDKNLLDVMKKCLNRDPKERPSIEELQAHAYLV